MTLEEACRLIDPATDLDALAEIEYYNGFKGKDAAAKALHEASQMVVDFVRQMSWHDAKNPPIAHEESWECAGGKVLRRDKRHRMGVLRERPHHERLGRKRDVAH